MIHQIRPDLFLIELNQKLTGFRQFISSWVYYTEDLVFVVDPGPSSTIPVLINALRELGVKRLDYILLTHIHIDHAGGAGLLLEFYPEAGVNCHPRGIDHLIEPEKLWAGSLQVLGPIAEAYGPIAPVQMEKISWNSRLTIKNLVIEVIETPGHASHHVCYLVNGFLFAGEVAGVNVPDEHNEYLRIATPPVFKYEIYRDSLTKAANLGAKNMCFGHFGFETNPVKIFRMAVDQLELWLELVGKYFNTKTDQQILKDLLESDRSLKGFLKLPADIQKREEYFCLNSIRGMRGYFEAKTGKS